MLRFSKEEASEFLKAALRFGVSQEDLVLGYWRRANKDAIALTLGEAKNELNRKFFGARAGYGLQYALDEHLGWMREAGVKVPMQILEELAEAGSVLARHAKENVFNGLMLMPVVNMLAPVIPDELVKDVRISTAKSYLVKNRFLFGRNQGIDTGNALNSLQGYDVLPRELYEPLLYFFGRKLAMDYYKYYAFELFSSPGIPDGLHALVSTWNWSGHANDVYGRFFVANATLDTSNKSLLTANAARVVNEYRELSAANPPSPAMAKLMSAQLEEIINEGVNHVKVTEVRDELSKLGADASGEDTRSMLEDALAFELRHPGYKEEAVISPQAIMMILGLHRKLGGTVNGSQLQEPFKSYVKRKLTNLSSLNSDGINSFVEIASNIGMGPRDDPELYLGVASEMGNLAQNDIHWSPILQNQKEIMDNKSTLEGLASGIVRLAKLTGNTEPVKEQFRLTAEALKQSETEFGFGLHYLSSLIIEWHAAFKSSPFDVLTRHIGDYDLRKSFSVETERTLRARIYGDAKRQVTRTYDKAYLILFGVPVPRNEAANGQLIAQPQGQVTGASELVVYFGSKTVDGSNPATVRDIRDGLDKVVGRTLSMDFRTIPKRQEEMYGIHMSPEEFAKAVAYRPFSSAVWAIAGPSHLLGKLEKKGNGQNPNFKLMSEGNVTYLLANTGGTFALHHVNAVAKALSPEKPGNVTAQWTSYQRGR